MINPATEEVLKHVEGASRSDVDQVHYALVDAHLAAALSELVKAVLAVDRAQACIDEQPTVECPVTAGHSTVGVALAAVSLVIMSLLSYAQRRAGRELGSAGAVADSRQTLLCTYLSGVLLVGLLLFGWSWADPIVARITLLEGRHPEMWEMKEIDEPPAPLPADGIVQVMLPGAVNPMTLQRVGRTFRDAANFDIPQEGWEQWKILNVSVVAHPIHLVQFQTLGRELVNVAGFDPAVGGTTTPVAYLGEGTLDPDEDEQGWKDTVRVNGSQVVDGVPVGELVSIIGQFGGASGRFVYHCHILEHEDEGMMSAFVVMPEEIMVIDPHMGGKPHH